MKEKLEEFMLSELSEEKVELEIREELTPLVKRLSKYLPSEKIW